MLLRQSDSNKDRRNIRGNPISDRLNQQSEFCFIRTVRLKLFGLIRRQTGEKKTFFGRWFINSSSSFVDRPISLRTHAFGTSPFTLFGPVRSVGRSRNNRTSKTVASSLRARSQCRKKWHICRSQKPTRTARPLDIEKCDLKPLNTSKLETLDLAVSLCSSSSRFASSVFRFCGACTKFIIEFRTSPIAEPRKSFVNSTNQIQIYDILRCFTMFAQLFRAFSCVWINFHDHHQWFTSL